MAMLKQHELPLAEPIYSTYHSHGLSGALLYHNPSLRNWYLNESLNLTCSRMFLSGFSTPDLNISNTGILDNPHVNYYRLSLNTIGTDIQKIIPAIIQEGYYMHFCGIDDYYVKNKSWYEKRHFIHDGLLIGFDNSSNTYTLFAYDNNWIYRVFRTPQKCFIDGVKNGANKINDAYVWAIKPRNDIVEFDPKRIGVQLRNYLNSSLEKYPTYINSRVYGRVVQEYIVMYLDMLGNGCIAHEKMDWRILRLLWDHKRIMLERILLIEQKYDLSCTYSNRYEVIVKEMNALRMLYASYHLKERGTIIKSIRARLADLNNSEFEVLSDFTESFMKII